MATATRTGIAKAATATAELTDIEVLEVANVDAPANKRSFVVVKSAEGGEVPASEVPSAPADPAAPAEFVPSTEAETVPIVPESAPPAPEPVAKRGAKMAKERLDRLVASVGELAKIVKELQDEVEAEGESTDKSKVAKADEPNPLAPKLEELTKSVSDLQIKLDAQAKEIADQRASIAKQAEIIKAAKQTPAPNSSEPEEVAKSAKPFSWPNDMNAQRT